MIVTPANKYGGGKNFQITPYLKVLMDGLLLGDASYITRSTLSAYIQFTQRIDRLDWINYVRQVFQFNGIESRLLDIPARSRVCKTGVINAGHHVQLTSMMYRNLLAEREKWYQDGRKIVPNDVDVSNPITLSTWYMGDGSLLNNLNCLRLRFHTDGFHRKDVEWLLSEIDKHFATSGHIAKSGSGHPVLTFMFRDAITLLDVMRPHVLQCFAHKISEPIWNPPECLVCGLIVPSRRRMCKYCPPCAISMRMARRRIKESGIPIDVLELAKMQLQIDNEWFLLRPGVFIVNRVSQ